MWIVGIHKLNIDTKLRKNVIKLGVGTTIEIVGRDDLIPFLGQINDRVKNRTGSGGDPKTGSSSIKGCLLYTSDAADE